MSELFLGKFQSLEEVLKAYQALESNYTKKCQLIAKLKKDIQSLQDSQIAKEQNSQNTLVAPTPENMQSSKAQDNSSIEPFDLGSNISDNVSGLNKTELYDLDAQIESFFQAYPQAKQYARLIGQAITAAKPTMIDFLSAFVSVLLSISPQDYLSDQDFLENFVYTNEKIKQYFIQSYLDGLCKGAQPKTICGKTAVISVTPPISPKSLDEACNLAKKILTK